LSYTPKGKGARRFRQKQETDGNNIFLIFGFPQKGVQEAAIGAAERAII